MRLDRYIAKNRIIDIQSSVLEGALSELLDVCPLPEKGKLSKDHMLKALLDREKNMTTHLGNGVALPHVRVPIKRPYIFAIGRCPEGLEYEGMEEYRDLRLIFLLIASDKEKSYLKVLASLARIFQNKDLIDQLVGSVTLDDFRSEVRRSFGSVLPLPGTRGSKFNRLILKESEKIAHGAGCSSMMIFGDTFTENLELTGYYKGLKTILVTQSSSDVMSDSSKVESVINIRSYSKTRLSQMRSSVLIGLSRGVIKFDDKVCCIGGTPGSNQFDTVVVIDVEKEFQTVFNQHADMLPATVKPEVMERVLAISTELAVEGREGKPVGALFVIGEAQKLKPFSKPLVLNPFYGYKDEDRNILNPFMDETVKEFSTIDGAFIISGDGVLESAGSLIYAPDFAHELPGGLGSRHAAAAAVSKAADCIAITVSASTRQVTIFRKGQMLPLM